MLVFRERQGAIIRIPTIALMLAGLWGMIAAVELVGPRGSRPATGWFAVLVCATFALGVRVIRRVDGQIVSTGLMGSRYVPGRRAVLGIRMRASGRYAHLALDVMPLPDFGRPDLDAVTIDSFTPNGMADVMRAARRASSLLGLPEPIVAPGLIDDSSRGPAKSEGFRALWRLDLRGQWAASSNWSKLLVLLGAGSVFWTAGRALVHPGAQLDLRCASSWHVRNDPMSFNFTCPDDFRLVDVPSGPTVLGVWDPARACWIERRFTVPKKGRAVVHVDETVKANPCSANGWPPP